MAKEITFCGPLPRSSIHKYFKKMYPHSIYRLLLILLGLPTAIMVMVKHFFFSDSAAYDKLRRELESEFEADGLLKKLMKQAI